MSERTVTTELRGHVLLIGLNREAKRNAFNVQMLNDLSDAYAELEATEDAWVGVLFAHGDHFTAGLDLPDVSAYLADRESWFDGERINPLDLDGVQRTKPIVAAAQGWCLTIGIELLLASDIRIADSETKFSQLEVQRGIYAFGGATIRFPREAGWGNAMRWILTGDKFDAAEAHRIGLIQEVTEPGQAVNRAIELAEHIAEVAAPLGVQAMMKSARTAFLEGEQAARKPLINDYRRLAETEDAAEGKQSFVERRSAKFIGK
ncbi:enoyl-CoA hydratase [Pseudonocardiaceae bacterium YIM PH 21723]|nr:enoyl-CoA hydratase [Pseudonocardiaceae bacterium YIM PH 21723]